MSYPFQVFSLEEFTSRKFPSFPGALSIKASPSVTMGRLLSAWKVWEGWIPTGKDRVRVICWAQVSGEEEKKKKKKESFQTTEEDDPLLKMFFLR